MFLSWGPSDINAGCKPLRIRVLGCELFRIQEDVCGRWNTSISQESEAGLINRAGADQVEMNKWPGKDTEEYKHPWLSPQLAFKMSDNFFFFFNAPVLISYGYYSVHLLVNYLQVLHWNSRVICYWTMKLYLFLWSLVSSTDWIVIVSFAVLFCLDEA